MKSVRPEAAAFIPEAGPEHRSCIGRVMVIRRLLLVDKKNVNDPNESPLNGVLWLSVKKIVTGL